MNPRRGYGYLAHKAHGFRFDMPQARTGRPTPFRPCRGGVEALRARSYRADGDIQGITRLLPARAPTNHRPLAEARVRMDSA